MSHAPRRAGALLAALLLGFVGVGLRLGYPQTGQFQDYVEPTGRPAPNVVGSIGTDQEGLAGVEYAYQQLLGGKPGFRVLEQDPLGNRIPQGIYSEVPPVSGSDLLLTIDPDVQLAAERALADGV